MRKIYLLLISILFAATAFAQQPILKIADKDSGKVQLTALKIDVKIVANIAITTMEMQFCNSSKRVLEGELTFPLPEGVSINRYALDMNGIMREAVPIEKEKGQVVFENTIRKKVDPGLLEKVEGNNFRTRIYPLPSGGCRTIIIGYQEVLRNDGSNALQYNLPLQTRKPIASFSFDLNVYSKNQPEIGKACNTNLKLVQGQNVYTAHTEETNFTPKGSFAILMPLLANDEEIVMQKANDQYYFLINHTPTYEVKERKIEKNIAIIWDNSFSGLQYNRKKELELIIALMQKINNGTIQLSTIGYRYNNLKTYTIANGICEALIMDLQNMVYDGATNYSKIQYFTNVAETYLFTDGINTYGNFAQMQNSSSIVHTVTCAPTANFTNLKSIANTNGGLFINLNNVSATNALLQLTQNPYKLIGIQHNNDISEVYPKNATVNGNLAIAGISNVANTTFTLQYGYGNVVTNVVKVNLDAAKNITTQLAINKIWAQQKIEVLDEQYDLYKKAIEELGKTYNIVTRNTSLIVLDDVMDFVKYEIAPPADLRKAYDSVMSEKAAIAKQELKDLMGNSKSMMENLLTWYNTDYRPMIVVNVMDKSDYTAIPNAIVTINGKAYETNALGAVTIFNVDTANVSITKTGYSSAKYTMNGYTNQTRNVYLQDLNKPKPLTYSYREVKKVNANTIQGRVLNHLGQPLQSAIIFHQSKSKNINTDANGFFNYNWSNSATLQISYAGFDKKNVTLKNGTYYDIVLQPLQPQFGANIIKGNINEEGASFYARGGSTVTTTDSAGGRYYYTQVPDRERDPAGALGVYREVRVAAGAPPTPPPPVNKVEMVKYTPAAAEMEVKSITTSKDAVGNAVWYDTDKDGVKDMASKSKNEELHIATSKVSYFNIDNNTPNATINLKEINSNKAFIKTLEKTAIADRYKTYLNLRKEYLETPSFYFAVAKFFMANKEKELGLQIMSNIADINLNDHELYKLLGYELKKQGEFSEALIAFKKVLDWRPQEIQSYRDYGLALQDVGLYQNALDTLYTCITKQFDSEANNAYEGIEETILMDINNIIALQKSVSIKNIDTAFIKPLDVDVRVVLNWNMNDSDMDLWVFDPRGEKCFYSNSSTVIGGRLSNDFTAGYGPEQFILKQAKKGKYKVMLHYYGDGQQKLAGAATIMAEIYTNYGRPNQQRKLITLQMDKDEEREGILVGEFEF
jgi:tetratricopeptide (TPR) repeat protein